MVPSKVVRAWLLDIDGTLVFTDHLYRKVFQKLLTPLGYDVTDEFYAANVHGKVDADVFGKLMPAGTTEDELLAMSKRKDACFVELYQEETRAAGVPPMRPPPPSPMNCGAGECVDGRRGQYPLVYAAAATNATAARTTNEYTLRFLLLHRCASI